MKRLLHLTYDSPDNPWCGGGGAYRDWRILGNLPGWEREVWTGRHTGGSAPPTDSARLDLGIGMFGEFVSRRTYAWSASRRLRHELSTPGIVVSHSVSAWAPVWESLRHQHRTLNIVHHIAGDEILRRLGPFGPASLRYENRTMREGKFFSLSNRATVARIREVNPTARIEMIPIGFDPPTHPGPAERVAEGPVICFLGRMDHRMKGLDRLLDAFAILGSRLPDSHLVIAGRSDSSMKNWLDGRMREHPGRNRIHVFPNPDDRRKYALLDGSDIFCVPSRFEGWCIAAVEAQSRGLPVVATRTDGTSDSVDDGETGILVDNGEEGCAEDLAAALESLCLDRDRRRILGESAKRWAAQFTWESAEKATLEFLREVSQSAEAIRA